jgi:hypothetical protein
MKAKIAIADQDRGGQTAFTAGSVACYTESGTARFH